MTLALGLGLDPRTSFSALNRDLGQEALALAPGAAQERGPLKGLDEGRSRGSGRQARALAEEHLVKGLEIIHMLNGLWKESSTLVVRPGPPWVSCEGSIGPREAAMGSWGGELCGQHAHVAWRRSWTG